MQKAKKIVFGDDGEIEKEVESVPVLESQKTEDRGQILEKRRLKRMRAQERKLGALVETLEEEKQEQEEAKEEQKEEQKEEEPPKKKKKKSKKKKQAVPEPESNGREQALSYLSLFINSKSDWKFQKVRQMWILQNLYYPNMMDPQQFKDALEYMKDMSPKAKTETGQQAEQILQKLRDRQDLNPQEHQVIKRCKKVIKLCDKV